MCRERDDTTNDGTVPLVAYETILYQVDDDHVATVTLNRPDKLNSFNMAMQHEFRPLWRDIQDNDSRCTRSCCAPQATGRSRPVSTRPTRRHDEHGVHVGAPPNPFVAEDPGITLAPKQNECWKPIVCPRSTGWPRAARILLDRVRHRHRVGRCHLLRPACHLRHDVRAGTGRAQVAHPARRGAAVGADGARRADVGGAGTRDRAGLGGRRARQAVGASARDRRDRGREAERGHARNGEGDLAVARSHRGPRASSSG